jgi:hypothetical protein
MIEESPHIKDIKDDEAEETSSKNNVTAVNEADIEEIVMP